MKAKNTSITFLRGLGPANRDFECKQCGFHVNAEPFLSGVQNRNHCPYCLWSRHVDLYQAGDRLAACKGGMAPIGLSIKRSGNKYGPAFNGELMLIHQCIECGRVSINRIAADDIPEGLYEVYTRSLGANPSLQAKLRKIGILALGKSHDHLVKLRLFGASESVPDLRGERYL